MTGPEMADGTTPAELPNVPDHLAGALREFRTGRSDSTGDPELEALRAAILLEEIGGFFGIAVGDSIEEGFGFVGHCKGKEQGGGQLRGDFTRAPCGPR